MLIDELDAVCAKCAARDRVAKCDWRPCLNSTLSGKAARAQGEATIGPGIQNQFPPRLRAGGLRQLSPGEAETTNSVAAGQRFDGCLKTGPPQVGQGRKPADPGARSASLDGPAAAAAQRRRWSWSHRWSVGFEANTSATSRWQRYALPDCGSWVQI
jgi:hypothetical protein